MPHVSTAAPTFYYGIPRECVSSWEDHVDSDHPEMKFKKLISTPAVEEGLTSALILYRFVALYMVQFPFGTLPLLQRRTVVVVLGMLKPRVVYGDLG
ncbi:uncharacterized protein J3R85_019486 [Psidium guajava]|nr:uncharacterized protein J3R85_019486 [Psidium guajava]